MKKSILALLLVFSVAQSALASGPYEVKQVNGRKLVLVPLAHARQVKAINDNPNLSDAQKMVKIKPIMLSMFSEAYCRQAASVYSNKDKSVAVVNNECLQVRANIQTSNEDSPGISQGVSAENIRIIYSIVVRSFISAD